MKEKVINKINSLNDSNLAELSNYIDFLRFRTQYPNIYKAENLLDHFRQFRVFSWKELAIQLEKLV